MNVRGNCVSISSSLPSSLYCQIVRNQGYQKSKLREMAAAYAAVVTLTHTIDQIQLHPRPPISLDIHQVQSLSQNLTFLQKFLEDYSHEVAGGLLSRIADAAYAGEDIIESGVVDQFLDGEKKFYECLQQVVHQVLAGSTTHDVRVFYECLQEVVLQILARFTIHEQSNFHECLQKVVEGMDLLKKEAMEIKDTTPTTTSKVLLPPSRSSFTGQNMAGSMVGNDDVLIELMDKLTSEESNRKIIPIVGMGGIGKTTLARTVYSSMLIQQHFDVCAWTTISQEYILKEILIEVLSQVSKRSKDDLSDRSEEYLKETLHKFLSGRRYLIIIDDIWNIEVWEDIQLFFPHCENKSRVIITTRLSNLANQLVDESCCLKMKFLDDDKSWGLFCKVVFGEEDCPVDLEEIGKKIVKGCKGLPLSITVVAGLLAKSEYEVQYWEYVGENLSSVVNLDSNEHCLRILHMSYCQLPTHLKPCFLYMGVFPEDKNIRVSELIELWVDEGFLKPMGGKTQEVVAQEYFHELVDRNLILVHELGSIGNIKYCKIHDLLRDLCLREAQNERFHNVLMLHNLYNVGAHDLHRRETPPEWSLLKKNFNYALQFIQLFFYSWRSPVRLNSRLLRIWTKWHRGILGSSSSHSYLLLLSTLKKQNSMILRSPSEIWKMPQLRHVRVGKLNLPGPPYGNHVEGNDIILGNLQTLSGVVNFKCSEEIINRIPNLKKLGVAYNIYLPMWEDSCHFLHNIEHLCKLESFRLSLMPNGSGYFHNLTFPNSLKKLTIQTFYAEDFLEKIGSLPHLVKLKLIGGYFVKHEWVTTEGQFRSLRILVMKECYKLECWQTESSHFPRLERLTLYHLDDLKEIPSDIGEIPTLESIHVIGCSESVAISARKIKEEQVELGNESLQIRIEQVIKKLSRNVLSYIASFFGLA